MLANIDVSKISIIAKNEECLKTINIKKLILKANYMYISL